MMLMIVNRPRRQIGCRIGVHWWSVLSCEPASDTWRRHCLFCGRRQFFADTASNGLEDKRFADEYIGRLVRRSPAPERVA